MAEVKDNENEKERPKDFEEIEKKLKEALARKDEEMKKELKERASQEKEEAKANNPEDEESKEKMEAPPGAEAGVSELKDKAKGLQDKIREHLNKVLDLRREIEALTGRIADELEMAKELSERVGDLGQEVEDKISSIKKEIEEEFKREEKVPEKEEVEEGVDFGEELARVKKLKDILEKPEAFKAEEEKAEEEIPAPEVPEEAAPPEGEAVLEIAEEKIEVPPPEMETAVEEAPPTEESQEVIPEEVKTPEAPVLEEKEEKEEKQPLPEEEKKVLPEEEKLEGFKLDETMETMFSGRWKKHWTQVAAEEKMGPEAQEGAHPMPQRRRASDFAEVLEKYKKNEPPEEDAELWYYQHNEKMILDSECLISSLAKHLAEGKKLYTRLAQTTSPKDQFFVKQEIIRHQEALRDVFLKSVKLLEKASCELPKFTQEIVNMKFLKETLEKLSIENWSNQDDFTFFDENMEKIKTGFNEKITPKVEYLRSIVEELGV